MILSQRSEDSDGDGDGDDAEGQGEQRSLLQQAESEDEVSYS